MRESLKEFMHTFKEHKGGVIGVCFLTFIILLAIFPFLFSQYDPIEQFREYSLVPPFWQEGGNTNFLLGTDVLGRDLLSRIVHGTRYTLFIGILVVVTSLVIGIIIGTFAGYYGGSFDAFICRIMDIILSFPGLLLALVLVTILGPGLINAMLSIAVVQLPHFVRLTRAQIMSEKHREYYISGKIIGMSDFQLMFKILLPNCLSPLIVQSTLNFSNAILDAAALGFLGLGAQPPIPEWGTLLADSREFILRAWWVVTFPGLMILLTVLSINLIGDGLRDTLDPKLKKS